MREVVIKAAGLFKEYSGFPAVKGIDFEVVKGECFGFLGPNGAGKTTTMNMVQGYSPLSGGSLTVFGMDIGRDPRKIKARIGVVPQENNLDPDLSVIENLRVYARYFDIPRDEALRRAATLLDFVALAEKKDEHVMKLSGGMKRRLMVARALINDPELIVLDEPTTGLDPQARHVLWQKLKGLKKEGRTMVLTTHYMEDATQLCDRLVIMDNGKILDEGSPDELIKRHVRGYVVELTPGEGGPDMVNKCLEGLDYEYEVSGDTMYIFTDDTEPVLSNASCFMADGFVHRKSTLEDVFLRLTGRGLRE
ncbi:MAG TPA: ATP-binding cassette domain-containing protein [Nitrospirota bacterium]|jgi:lipooligosaccharide transport system ATP-binding protein